MSRRDDIQEIVSGMVGEAVIWADQTAPRPLLPYWTLRLSSRRVVGSEEWSQGVDDDGVMAIDGIREETLEVQRLGEGSMVFVEDLRDELMKSSIKESWRAKSLVIFDFGDVLFVPYRNDSAAYESRATLDLFLRSKATVTDQVGAIETVHTDATLSETSLGTNLAWSIEAVYTGP